MNYKAYPEYQHHEQVINLNDFSPNLTGFIAIHNSKPGPALGGTRILRYRTQTEALRDALRLSHAMTYKCAISGLPFGGGKGVIAVSQNHQNFETILKDYALVVKALGGLFYTGEDVGLSEKNVQYMLKFAPFFIGKTGQAGDPSEYAAQSCYLCILTALKHKKINPKHFSIAIKGVGKTGKQLVKLISRHTNNIAVADVDKIKLNLIKQKFPFVKVLPPHQIHKTMVDVFAPCALGNEINNKTFGQLNCRIICGTANNQLANSNFGKKLYKNHILYIPDFLANAGGLINVADELLPGNYKKLRVENNINSLRYVLKNILNLSSRKKIDPNLIAIKLAEKRLQYV